MRLWSIHPKYLDSKGLVALWREALLAQKVLYGKTKGYKNHPQLIRFKELSNPLTFIGTYLNYICLEAKKRGYNFDESKILKKLADSSNSKMKVTVGQINFELAHLKKKLQKRSPADYSVIKKLTRVQAHPLFVKKPGKVEDWEIV